MLSERGEFVANATIGSAGEDLQLACAVTNHIAVMVNGNAFKSQIDLNGGNYHYVRKHLFGEAALGYFVKKERVHFEIFAGYGMAEFNSYETSWFLGDDATTKGAYNRTFVQPSIKVNRGDDFRLILTTRFSSVDFISYTATDVASGEIRTRTFKRQGFFEPALTGQFRIYRKLHGYAQAAFNTKMNGSYQYDHNQVQFALGLQFRTSPKPKDVN